MLRLNKAAVATLLLVILPSLHAATLTVTSSADSGPGTLRALIAAANVDDEIVFDPSLSGSTITLLSDIELNASLSIVGLGVDNLSISGGSATRLFRVNAGSSTIAHLTLRDGLAVGGTGGDSEFGGGGGGGTARGGGIAVLGGTLTVEAVVLRNNEVRGGDGGASGVPGAGNTGGAGGQGNPILANGNGGAGGDGTIVAMASATTGSAGTYGGGAGGGGGGGLNASGTAYLSAAGGSSSTDQIDAAFAAAILTGHARAGSDGRVFDADSNPVFEPSIPPGTGAGGAGGAGLGGAVYVAAGASFTVIDSHFANNRALGGQPGARGSGIGLGRAGAIFAETGSTVQAHGLSFGAGSLEGNYQSLRNTFPSNPAYQHFAYGTKMVRNPGVYGVISPLTGSGTIDGPLVPAHLGDPRVDWVLWDEWQASPGNTISTLLERLGRRGIRSEMASPMGFAIVGVEDRGSGIWLVNGNLVTREPAILVDQGDSLSGDDTLVIRAIGADAETHDYMLEIVDGGAGAQSAVSLDAGILRFEADIAAGFTALEAKMLLEADKALAGAFAVDLGPDFDGNNPGNDGSGNLSEWALSSFNDSRVAPETALLAGGPDMVVFVPYNDFLTVAGEFDQQPTMTVRGWDGIGGSAGDRIDLSSGGVGGVTSSENHVRADVSDSLVQRSFDSVNAIRFAQDTLFDSQGLTISIAEFPMTGNRHSAVYTLTGVGGIWASGLSVSSLGMTVTSRPSDMWQFNRRRLDGAPTAPGSIQFGSIGGSDRVTGINPVGFSQKITTTNLEFGNFTAKNSDSAPIPLVRDANATAAGVSHFKILEIENGTLFSDSAFSVPLSVGDFVSYGNGNARVYMRPATDFVGDARFQIQQSTSASDPGLTGDPIDHYLTVDNLADTLSSSTVMTNEDEISPAIEIRRSAGLDAGLRFVRITNISNGSLYFDSDGRQPVGDGDVVGLYAVGGGLAGVDLFFDPTPELSGTGQFDFAGWSERRGGVPVGNSGTAVINVTPVVDVASVALTSGIFGPAIPTLEAQVMFEAPVTVNQSGGAPNLAIDIGGQQYSASYAGGSGTTSLTFGYTLIGTEPDDADGVEILANSISIPVGSSILAAGQPLENPDFCFEGIQAGGTTVDLTPPAMPTTPDLEAASDTGDSDTDNLTADVTPTFSGFAEPGALVTLSEGTNPLGTDTADASTGAWTITSVELAAGEYTISATATDVAGNVSENSGDLVVTVNRPPAIVVPMDIVVDEDGVFTFAATDAINVTDSDGTQPMMLAATVSNGVLFVVPGSGSTVMGDGTQSVSISGSLTQVSAALAGATYVPDDDYFGAASLSLMVTDGVESAMETVDVDVVSVNDPPQFELDTNPALPTDSTGLQVINNFAFNISPGPANESGQTLGFALTEIDDPFDVISDLSMTDTGTLSFTASGRGGAAQVSVVLTDSGGGMDSSAPAQFGLTVGTPTDIRVTKTDGRDIVFDGMAQTYLIVVKNLGPHDAPSVVVTDVLPSELTDASWECFPMAGVTCPASGTGSIDEVINLPVSGEVTFILTATVSGLVPAAALHNTATATLPSNQGDTAPANNSATDVSLNGALFFDGFEVADGPLQSLLRNASIKIETQ